MTYRVVCTYHPDIGTFRGKRGAWRVYHCFQLTDDARVPTVQVIGGIMGSRPWLCINSIRLRQPNSWCNPRKIFNEWQEAHR